tara:strand:- start:555 stop:833 length:279 start_codon:yes stop_codon:yes gene_type:complete
MEFLIGLGVVLLLIPFFIIVTLIMKLLPQDYTLISVILMLVGDGVIALMWFYIWSEFTETPRILRLGIAAGFALLTIVKVTYLLLTQLKELK